MESTLSKSVGIKAVLLTSTALIAFAANSLFCRLALGSGAIDAASFTATRMISGAIALCLIAMISGNGSRLRAYGNWWSAIALFVYAAAFSFAYLSVSAATGGLILFGSVQATMIVWGLVGGERPTMIEWTGLGAAIGGLVYLVAPGVDAPPLNGAILMCLSGIAWGVFSLRGRGSTDPLLEMTQNFVRTIPFVVLVSVVMISDIHITTRGVVLGLLSGVLASGVGYIFWYAALRYLSAIHAASAQIVVPVIIAIGGVVFLGEPITTRLIIASVVILGGVSLVVGSKRAS